MYIEKFDDTLYQSKTKEELIDELLRLRQEREQQQWFLNSIPDILFRYDKEGNYLDYAGSKTKSLYSNPKSLLGKNIRQVLPPDVANKMLTAIAAAITTKIPQRIEYVLTLQENVYSFEGRITNFSTDNVLLIVRDMTEMKRLQTDVERLAQLSLAGEIASCIGHEIRNPLTTVRGFLQMMARRNEDRTWDGYIEIMIAELDSSNTVITEFLSLAQDKNSIMQRQQLREIIASLKSS